MWPLSWDCCEIIHTKCFTSDLTTVNIHCKHQSETLVFRKAKQTMSTSQFGEENESICTALHNLHPFCPSQGPSEVCEPKLLFPIQARYPAKVGFSSSNSLPQQFFTRAILPPPKAYLITLGDNWGYYWHLVLASYCMMFFPPNT